MVPPKRRYLRRYRLNFYPRPKIKDFATGTPQDNPTENAFGGDPERNPSRKSRIFARGPRKITPPKMLSAGTPVRRASMAKQADARDLKSLGTSRIGSNPITRTSAGAGRIGPRPCFLLRFSADSVESGVHGGYPSARQATGHEGASAVGRASYASAFCRRSRYGREEQSVCPRVGTRLRSRDGGMHYRRLL